MDILSYSTYVFDLDGVIINSEPFHYHCYKKAFEKCIDYKLEWNEYCQIHHSIDTTFSIKFPIDYEEIYSMKNKLYKEEIINITLVEGFQDFFNVLIKNGKRICIVTDATYETFNIISEKYRFLNKSNIIITRDNTQKRKPDSECYLNLLSKLPGDIENNDILVFEDSYKGWTAASRVIYNCVLVNNKEYIYYDKINAQNTIPDYKDILNLKIKPRFEYIPFYISSKTIHREKWLNISMFLPVVANWIHINKEKHNITTKDKEMICNLIKDDIDIASFGILYLEKDESDHIGSLIEIGLMLANNKKIYICGENLFKDEVLFNFKKHLDFSYANKYNLLKIFNNIQHDMNEEYNIFKRNTIASINMMVNEKQVESKTKYVIDYLVICASGKGTRLLPITQHIPKLLVNSGDLNLISKIIDYWKSYSEKFVVIIDSKYNKIVDFYLKLTGVKYEIINVDCANGEENSYTLNRSLQNEKYTNKKILITWCDIFPDSIIPPSVFKDQNIIFTYKNYGRYEAYENTIQKRSFGNIIGIYYFASFSHVRFFEPKMDICDCYKNNFGDFETFEIDNLIDIGDYNKLCEVINNTSYKYSTRYFNKITDINDDLIEKQSTCIYGDKIITDEMAFYKFHVLDNIPEIIGFKTNSFVMKKILNSDTLYKKFIKVDIRIQQKMLTSILREVDKIHSIEQIQIDKDQLEGDIKIEFYDKLLIRLGNIDTILKYFNHIKSVNNVKIKFNHNFIIEDIYKKIKFYLIGKGYKYSSIHGDPHMSNVIVDENNKMWFIDPRGYFGNTKLFGPPEYDISKIVYSLSGFDQVNTNPNHFFTIDENNNIEVNITNNIDNYLHLFDKYDKKILLCMTILHWFGLTDYSKNNIHKCISSYYYGIYLYQLYIEN